MISAALKAWVAALALTCSGPTDNGWQCMMNVTGYPEPVAVFIPPNFKPDKKIELDLHLHGHLRAGETFNGVLKEFNFGKMLKESGRNSILIVPSSKGACETYDGILANKEGFQTFIGGVEKQLGAKASKKVLSGHSGAYRAVSAILDYWPPDELYIYDGFYGYQDRFSNFVTKNPNSRFWSIFTNNDVTARIATKAFWQLQHPDQPEGNFNKQLTSIKTLKTTSPKDLPKVGQINYDMNHWGSVNAFFPIFMKVPPEPRFENTSSAPTFAPGRVRK